MMGDVIYLDHGAATPLDQRVKQAMDPYVSAKFFNPSSPYAPAIAVRRDYEAAKRTIAGLIGARSDQLIMTAGATESINLAFNSVRGHVVTAEIEHHAVLAAAQTHDHSLVKSDQHGRVLPEVVLAAIRPDTELVSIALANNELGTVQPLRSIASVIRAERERRLLQGNARPLYFHTDASQGAGQLDIHVARLGVDLLTLNAGKIYGPKQTGLLWAANHVNVLPQIVGGGQERGLRSGTENVPGVIGFAKAMEIAVKSRPHEVGRLRHLRDELQAALLQRFPEAVVSGHAKHRLPGHLHISFPGLDAERLLFAFESKGVLVATGSACAANHGTRSHVLTAIGLSPEVADGSLRLTLGKLNDETTVARAGEIIINEIERERQRRGL